MKYIVKKPFGNVKVGEVLEGVEDGGVWVGKETKVLSNNGRRFIHAEVVALMLNAGFLEESDGKWRPKFGDVCWYITFATDDLSVIKSQYPDTSGYVLNKEYQTKELAEAGLAEIREVLKK